MIRHALPEDLEEIMRLFERARSFMRQSGNASQWINGYPSCELIMEDIRKANFYVEETEGVLSGCFAFIAGEEPTYGNILGSWPDDNPYGTIHRLASSGAAKGFTDRCVSFCLTQIPNLRADTHRDNLPMQRALLRNGFSFRGIIHVADGSERLAYSLSGDSKERRNSFADRPPA